MTGVCFIPVNVVLDRDTNQAIGLSSFDIFLVLEQIVVCSVLKHPTNSRVFGTKKHPTNSRVFGTKTSNK